MAKYVRKSREELRKRRILKALILTLSLALLITGGVLFFRKRVQERFASGSSEEIKSAEVTVGSIKTTISGSGNLASEGVVDVEIPVKITVEDTLVEAGDSVAEGQLLATVNVSSALSALKKLQDELDALDTDIQSASGDTASAYIYAGVAGGVKAIFAQAEDDVSAVMAEHGALAVLSLDGYMAVDIPAGGLVEMETGVSDGELVEILSGLSLGDSFYYRYADTVTYSFLTV